MNKTKLVITDGRLHRSNIPGEDLKGIIFFADQCQKELELENLNLLYWKEINCWPSARTLLQMTDRHAVLARAVKCGFVSHPVVQGAMEDKPRLPFPFVLKTGFDHRGEGKFLINSESEIPEWEGVATIEPFFVGESARILIIGEEVFALKFTNETSWIKNSVGADHEMWDNPPPSLVAHALAVMQEFDLEVAGVDYIVTDNSFHFLEINQFPGVNVSDETAEAAKKFLNQKMILIEEETAARRNDDI